MMSRKSLNFTVHSNHFIRDEAVKLDSTPHLQNPIPPKDYGFPLGISKLSSFASLISLGFSLSSPHLDRAKFAFSPFDMIGFREVNDRSWLRNLYKISQPLRQYLPLKLLVKRVPHGVAQGKSHQQSSRRFYFLGDSPVEGYGDC